MIRLLAKFLVPHSRNNHHPHSIRPHLLAFYLISILSVQLLYNFLTTGEVKVLSFATNIQQQEIISLTNAQRQSNGFGAVRESSLLDQVAAKKAADMFANNYWAHVSPSGVTPWYWFDQTGYQYSYAGENLARDFDTSNAVVVAWMNSPSHRENLLFPQYTEIGVAVVNGQLLGHDTTLVVQEFGRPLLVATSSPTPQPAQQPAPSPAATTPVSLETPAAPSKPVISNPYIATPKSETDVSFQPAILALTQLNTGQLVMVAILLLVGAFFLFDALIMWRRHKDIVIRGHSFLHASIIAMVVILILTTSFGVLR